MQRYITIRDFQPEWYSDSEQSLRWFIRKNQERLLKARAIARFNKRITINPEKFWETVDEMQEVG